MKAIYSMVHSSIEFTSLSEKQVLFYEKALSSVSIADVKNGSVVGRHRLLLNMGLAGQCPLFNEYLHVREYLCNLLHSNVKSCEAKFIVLGKFGWTFN